MSATQRKWAGGHTRWRLHWTDTTVFKVEQEADNLTDRSIEEWTFWMESELKDRFGDAKPRLVASSLNFSRNSLGDDAMQRLVTYLRGREISVQTLKLFRNSIGDRGAQAIGKLLASAHVPVHEVHLSHNELTEQGACSVLEKIAQCGRYPYLAEHAGRKDQRGHAPVWLRMEHNRINWGAIKHKLDAQRLRWCTADSRDGWQPKERAPMVCMHNSFRNQNAEQIPGPGWGPDGSQESEEPLTSQMLLAALQGDGEACKSVDAKLGQGVVARSMPPPSPQVQPAPPPQVISDSEEQAGEEAAEENVPLYVFLDAGAVMSMLAGDGVFTFEGLLNLCQQGRMRCTPHSQERDCIMLVITDAVQEELQELAQKDPDARRRYELLRSGQGSYLQLCLDWGIVELLLTTVHTQLMRLTPEHERLSRELALGKPAVKMLDFVSLWESASRTEGRVLVVTADPLLCRFCREARAGDKPELCPVVVHCDELNRLFAEDSTYGGKQLCEASLVRDGNPSTSGPVLSAALLAAVVGLACPELPPRVSETPEVPECQPQPAASELLPSREAELQQQLSEAWELLREMRPLLQPGREAERLVERLEAAGQRWQALLDGEPRQGSAAPCEREASS